MSMHAPFAQGTDHVKRYQPGIVPFVACQDPASDNMEALNPWMKAGESFYIIGDLPALPGDWTTGLCKRHVSTGVSSFLHVGLSNQRAIRLYEHMGFEKRREISFRRVKKGD